jgi:hypothetical protein
MTTYKEEYEELWAWYKKITLEKYDLMFKEPDHYRVAVLEREHQLDTEEFNRRLDALKEKYNMDTPVEQAV